MSLKFLSLQNTLKLKTNQATPNLNSSHFFRPLYVQIGLFAKELHFRIASIGETIELSLGLDLHGLQSHHEIAVN